MAYKRKTDGLDPERGDQMTLRNTDVAAVAALPPSIGDPIAGAFVRWFAGGEDKPLADITQNAILQMLKDKQRENVRHYIESCNNKGNGVVREQSGEVSISQHKSGELPKETETETETITETITETEPKPKEGVSDSGFDSVLDSVSGSALKSAAPGSPSTVYDDLKENLVVGILKIIGKENDPNEGKVWHKILVKAKSAGISRSDMIDVVYSWYSALKVDGEPKNRAAALNRHFHKALGLTS